jgi:hypothetical protein
MELDDLKTAWRQMDQRLAAQSALAAQLFAESRLDKARRHLRWLVFGQLLQLAFGIALTVFFARFWIAHRDEAALLALGLGMHAWGVLVICSSVVELLLLTCLQFAQPVVAAQRYLALLRRWRTRVSPWLGLPFLLLWMLGPFALAAWGAPITPAWLWVNLTVGVAIVLALRRLWRRARQPGHEGLARRIDDFLGGDSLRQARARLDEIARFEQE